MKELSKSPFKFLDAFEKEDKDLFFGREEEVEHLYDMTFDTRLIVFFGASGTGKTSLIQCGLANKFSETRWKELYIRREEDINQSILKQVNNELEAFQGSSDLQSPIEGLKLLHRYTAKPIYLTFDQFEELFVLQPSVPEQEKFFRFLEELLQTPLACKVILVMREEFIAHLWDYEYLIPSIFDNRFRIRQLQEDQMQGIVKKTLAELEKQERLSVENPDAVAKMVVEKLADGRTQVELTYLQVFLDRLYRLSEGSGTEPPVFRTETIERMGTIEDVIDKFLEEQLAVLEAELGPDRKGIPLKILGAMVSDERTKKVLVVEDMEAIRERYGITEAEMRTCLQAFERMRILNRYES